MKAHLKLEYHLSEKKVDNTERNLRFVLFSSEYYSLLEDSFHKYIEPAYGNQSAAIQKIVKGTDRNCEFLFVNNLPVGFIVYKTALQSEYGLEHAFELKTALLFEQFRKNFMGSILFERAESLARQYKANVIYATVSKELKAVFGYLKKNKWFFLDEKKSTDNNVNVYLIAKELC